MNTYQTTVKKCAKLLKEENITLETFQNFAPNVDKIHACRFFMQSARRVKLDDENKTCDYRTYPEYIADRIINEDETLTNAILEQTDDVKGYVEEILVNADALMEYF